MPTGLEPPTETSTSDALRVDAVWGDPTAHGSAGLDWGALPAIQRTINRRVTGDPSLSPLAAFFQRLGRDGRLPIGRALVVGCGEGRIERDIAANGWARDIVGVDLSPRVLVHAAAVARDAGLSTIRYLPGDMNRLRLDEAPFDVVLGVSAIHHCADLEALCDAVETLLAPGGWLYLDEYVGPSRFQWTDAQLRGINYLLDLLPDRLVRTASGLIRRNFPRATAASVAAFDPSEAVRSEDIPAVVAAHFDIVARHGYGGALLHMVLAHSAQNFMAAGNPTPAALALAERYLERLIAAEERLTQAGRIADDFMVIWAQRKGDAL